MNAAPGTPNRTSWLILTGALTAAPVMYVVVASLISAEGRPVAGPDFQTFRVVFSALAVVMLVASRLWLARRAGDGRDTRTGEAVPLPPAQYQLQSLIAAALAESCAIYGFILFMLGGSIRQLMAFAAGSLLTLALVVLPHGLAYWSRREAYDRTHPS